MMTEIETKKKDVPTGKSVLLFSGGMDSLIMNYLLKPDILLFISHGNKYQDVEMRQLKKLADKKIIDKKKLRIFPIGNWLGSFERDDAIIPNRNLYFITIATHFGEKIYLGSVFGDRSKDKSRPFFRKCENMFDYLFQEQHWCKGRTFSISASFKDFTKTQLVKKYLKEGGDGEHLKISYSCYEGKKKPCGWCKPCFRKWVALINNKIPTVNYFEKNPWEAPWLPELLPQIVKGEYRGREDTEILRALAKVSK